MQHSADFFQMKNNENKIKLVEAIDLLIADSISGVRLQPSGKRISKRTIATYTSLRSKIIEFEIYRKKNFEILVVNNPSSTVVKRQLSYWKTFYTNFKKFCLGTKTKNHDNYFGLQMKILKLVFKYIRTAKSKNIGSYEYIFYAQRQEPSIICFPYEKLAQALRKWKEYELPKNQKELLAIFLFGCGVGMRYSDLNSLTHAQLEKTSTCCYLNYRSQKTQTFVRIKLPFWALEVIQLYGSKTGKLFRLPQLSRFNLRLKSLAKLMNWDWPILKFHSRFGKIEYLKGLKFCDVVSSHVMRRSTITTLLSMGVPEIMVREISGHAKGSKEFYRYVQFSQTLIDDHTENAWDKLLKLH